MSRIQTSSAGSALASVTPKPLAEASPRRAVTSIHSLVKRKILQRLGRLQLGRLTLRDADERWDFGQSTESQPFALAQIDVHDRRFYRALALGGALGAADAYLQGWWTSNDLVSVIRILSRNSEVLQSIDSAWSRLLQSGRAFAHAWRRNTKQGSRRNIAAHYDLSNDFFALMLDDSMTYSAGVFASPSSSLHDASIAKYDRICRKLQLTPSDEVLEIGCGWGGFAEYAARSYGCRVTGVTISRQQYDFAFRRIAQAGLNDRVRLEMTDYRDLTGQYDKLVSIEMIEAVGREYLPLYFQQCSRLLKPDGMMALQAITIPDHRYDRYCHSVDFIQHYVFPGGFLPSVSAMADCWRKVTDFRLYHLEDFGAHYARTLRHWRERFSEHSESIRQLGMDDYFMRLWEFYLCYCEGGFAERQIGVSQILLTKPACRREAIILPWGEQLGEMS